MLERNTGVRLFHRSTRKLTLTDAGERFLAAIGGNLDAMQAAIAEVAANAAEPAGCRPPILPDSMVVNDAAAMREAALLGLGVTLPAVPDVLLYLERGDLVRLAERLAGSRGDIIIETGSYYR